MGCLSPIVLDRLLAVTLDCSCKGLSQSFLLTYLSWRRLPNAPGSEPGSALATFASYAIAWRTRPVHIAFDEITQRQCAELPHFRRNLVLRSTVIARARGRRSDVQLGQNAHRL